jgi:hypothetical protein
MPGPFTHIYTQRRVQDLLADGVTADFVRPADGGLLAARRLDPDGAMLDAQELGRAMSDWPKFAALGAVGPDIFFFLQDYADPRIPCDEIMLGMSLLYYLDDQGRLDDPYEGLLLILAEISDTWAGILRLILKLDKLWKQFLEVWNATIGAILDKAGQVIDDLTGGLLSELGDAFTELRNALIAVGAEEILTEGDIFAWFSLKMRQGYDEKAFLWSDMLHYRRTSRVPQRLFAHARDLIASNVALDREHGRQLLSFAGGWVCHVGTDTIAHSFVNEQAGGPFRTHWQRHHLVENHLDAYNYERTSDGTLPPDDFVGWQSDYPSLNQSALYFAVQIPQGIDDLADDDKQGDLRRHPLPDGDDRVSRAERDQMLDTDGALPDWLAAVIVKVLVEVYADPAEGGVPSMREEAKAAYHPRNLLGQAFQDALGDGASVLGHFLEVIGVDNAGLAFSDLRKAVAPDTPVGVTVPPGFPLPWEVQATYRFMLSWFKRSFVSAFDMAKPRRPTVFTPPASDFDFGPPDFSGVSASDSPIEQVCEVLAALLDWIWKTLEGAAQLAYDLAKTAASGATLPARDALYYGLVLPAWQVCENARMVLVHLAYLMPQSEQRYDDGELMKPSEIDIELVTLGHTVDGEFAAALAAAFDVLGNLDHDPALTANTIRNPKSGDYPWLPVRMTGKHDAVEFRRPWGFPDRTNDPDPTRAGNLVETPATTAGPYPLGTTPPTLLGTDGPANNRLRFDYEEAGCPEETDRLNLEFIGHQPLTNGYPVPEENAPAGQPLSGTNPLGDPVVFSIYLLGQIANNKGYATSFNLDADRAYGYLCWDWTRGEATAKNPRGQDYPAPVVWPEGADPAWQPPLPQAAGQEPAPRYAPPLQLQYPGRSCEQEPRPAPLGARTRRIQ